MLFGRIGKKESLQWQLSHLAVFYWGLEGLRRLQAIICPSKERFEFKDHHQVALFFFRGADYPQSSNYLSSNCYMQSAVPGFMGKVNTFCEPKIEIQSLM